MIFVSSCSCLCPIHSEAGMLRMKIWLEQRSQAPYIRGLMIYSFDIIHEHPRRKCCPHPMLYFSLSLLCLDGHYLHGPISRYVKLWVVHPSGMLETFSPADDFKPLVNDPNRHYGTCVTHMLWCMSRSLTHSGWENVPNIPGASAPAFLRIW